MNSTLDASPKYRGIPFTTIVGCTNLLNCVEKTHLYYDDKNTPCVRSARLQQQKKLLPIFPIDVKKIAEYFCLQRLRELIIEKRYKFIPEVAQLAT